MRSGTEEKEWFHPRVYISCFFRCFYSMQQCCCSWCVSFAVWQGGTKGMICESNAARYCACTRISYNWFIFYKWKFIFHLGELEWHDDKCDSSHSQSTQSKCYATPHSMYNGISIIYLLAIFIARRKSFPVIAENIETSRCCCQCRSRCRCRRFSKQRI